MLIQIVVTVVPFDRCMLSRAYIGRYRRQLASDCLQVPDLYGVICHRGGQEVSIGAKAEPGDGRGVRALEPRQLAASLPILNAFTVTSAWGKWGALKFSGQRPLFACNLMPSLQL